MKKLLASIAIAAITAVPFAGMAGDESDLTIDANSDLGTSTMYVDVETANLYTESNGVEGLQTEAFEGSDTEDAYEADTAVIA